MTDQQRNNVTRIAQAIRNGRNQMTESFAIGQVMLVTGRPYDKAVEGLAMMRKEKLFPDGFIEPQTDGALGRMLRNSPSLKKLIDRLDCVPGRSELFEFQGFVKPTVLALPLLQKRFSMPGF